MYYSNPLRVCLFVLLIVAALSGCDTGVAEVESPYYHQVESLILKLEPGYTVERRFAGRLEARQRVALGFELAGTVEAISVDEGDRVSAGQLLAKLDTRLLDAQQQQLNAKSKELAAQQKLAELELKRQQRLLQQGFAAEQRIDELTAELEMLAAQSQWQLGVLAELETRIAKSSLYAPYDGEVSLKTLDSGAVVNAGQVVLQVLELGQPQAKVGIPAEFSRQLVVGADAVVALGDSSLQARVLAVGNSIDSASNTIGVRLGLADDFVGVDGELVYLLLSETRNQPGYWVSAASLVAGLRGMWNVLALVNDAQTQQFKLEARSVDLLYMRGDRAFVTGAINDGASIVAAGVHRLTAGQIVRVGPAQ